MTANAVFILERVCLLEMSVVSERRIRLDVCLRADGCIESSLHLYNTSRPPARAVANARDFRTCQSICQTIMKSL